MSCRRCPCRVSHCCKSRAIVWHDLMPPRWFRDVLAQPFTAHSAVVTLYIGVLLRFSGLDILEPDALFPSPCHLLPTDVFWTIARRGLWRMVQPLSRIALRYLRTDRKGPCPRKTAYPEDGAIRGSFSANRLKAGAASCGSIPICNGGMA